MSLKSFHVFFIVTAMAFMLYFAYGSGARYLQTGAMENFVLAVSAAAVFAAGAFYLVWFLRKTRSLGIGAE